jgi:hypothetical protein
MGNYRSRKAKVRGFLLALNTLLEPNELKLSMLIACIIMFLFMNFALNEHPLAHCELRQSKLFLPYQLHTAVVIHLSKFFSRASPWPMLAQLANWRYPYYMQLTRSVLVRHRCSHRGSVWSAGRYSLTWKWITLAPISTKPCLLFQLTLLFLDA